jgi:hypothetical protein
MSWFHQLSDGNSRRAPRSSFNCTAVGAGVATGGAGVATGGASEVVGLVGVAGLSGALLHATDNTNNASSVRSTGKNLQRPRHRTV